MTQPMRIRRGEPPANFLAQAPILKPTMLVGYGLGLNEILV